MQIGNIRITRDRSPKVTKEELESVDEEYEKGLRSGKRLILGTLPARSGTMLLCDIFNEHQNATGVTERYFEAEAFYRYITYNKLPIDTAGIIRLIKYGIIQDWEKKGNLSLVFSPFFSHGIRELYDVLRPECIIFAINDPKFTVQSIYNKGFFKHHYIRERTDYALGFQPSFPESWSYLFGRLVPNGEFYNTWKGLTRIGKVSWWGDRVIVDIHNQTKVLPREKVFIFNLGEADKDYYKYYTKMAERFGLTPILSERKISALRGKRFKQGHNVIHEWSSKEQKEFEEYTREWYQVYHELTKEPEFK